MDFKAFTPSVKMVKEGCGPPREEKVRVVHSSSVGVDVHSNLMVVCHEFVVPATGELITETAECSATNKDLRELALKAKAPEIIVMESTGVYWLSLYAALEEVGFTSKELLVINAREFKAAKGRKTDWAYACRLATAGRVDSVQPSFIPSAHIRELRIIARDMQATKRDRSREVNRLHKVLAALGVRASSVFSDIRGAAASKVIDAWISGMEGEPFLDFIKTECGLIRKSPEEIYDAFAGVSISEGMRKSLAVRVQTINYMDEAYERKKSLLMSMMDKTDWCYINLLETIPGINRTSALLIYSELGPDLSSFLNSSKLASWAGLCPGSNTSAGKSKSGCCAKGNQNLRRVLIENAQSIAHMKKGALKDFFQAIKERRGYRKAIVALAHKLLKIIFSLWKRGTGYVEETSDSLKQWKLNSFTRAYNGLIDVNTSAGSVEIKDIETGDVVKKFDKPKKTQGRQRILHLNFAD